MVVTRQGEMHGTIGGGIMEQKLIELAVSELQEGGFSPFKKRQIHKPDVEKDRSGMICDGEQTVAFYHLTEKDLPIVRQIESQPKGAVVLDQDGITVDDGDPQRDQFTMHYLTENEWKLTEELSFQHTAYIFGGGHVGTAMSRTMSQLGFRVVQFDDRPGLYTMQYSWADEQHIINYEESDKYVEEGPQSYVIIMSFGYRPDEVIIRRLLGMNFKYIGLMGSKVKIETMWKNLRADGFKEEDLQKVHSPIGIDIKSKTTDEIAISVAAEVIRVKNQE